MVTQKKYTTEKQQINGYSLSRYWFDFAFEKPEAKSVHTALFMWILELNNRLSWKKQFGLPTQDTMEGLSIGNKKTYLDALRDLNEWGFIKIIQESKNQYSACIIEICRIKNDTTKTTALDSALQYQHNMPYQKSYSIGYGTNLSIEASIAPIDKPINNETNKPKENIKRKIEDLGEEFKQPSKWLDNLSMKYTGSIEKSKFWIDKFISQMIGEGKEEMEDEDAKSYCFRWIKYSIQKDGNIVPEKGNSKPTHQGVDKELVGKWIWRFGDWRDTTTFTDKQLRDNGLK